MIKNWLKEGKYTNGQVILGLVFAVIAAHYGTKIIFFIFGFHYDSAAETYRAGNEAIDYWVYRLILGVMYSAAFFGYLHLAGRRSRARISRRPKEG